MISRRLSRSFVLPTDHNSPRHSVCTCQCPLPLLCFQQLPTIKFCNPFLLITMQIARGVGGPSHFPFSLFNFRFPPSSLECAVPRFRALTPLECAVTKTRP